ncbi:MAG: iron-sulfur cluster assembly scaffold protein [Acidobacteria bacterium]|jgi:nitrogen fixation NifU-like protein|nr:iron-sulfur cluster assembly scaffold protein [Acidobacteriota bacterium]|tara:strand:- start:45 stop:461 length:417 start_codon:yes stop_codon:yes gene_type:complete
MVPTVWGEDADSMNQYSETFLDHYRRPRNLGDLVDSDAVAIVHNKVCGDVLRIAIAVEPGAEAERRRIIAIRFKAYGCAATIAVASVISEMVVGKRVADIDAISDDDVVAALDGLPAGRIHAVVLGRAALGEAMAKLS